MSGVTEETAQAILEEIREFRKNEAQEIIRQIKNHVKALGGSPKG